MAVVVLPLFLPHTYLPLQSQLDYAIRQQADKMTTKQQSSTFSYEGFKPSNLFDLTGRTAIVTGGATGIGLAQAQGLTAAGARVYILSRREDVLKDVVQKYGFAGYLVADVTNKESIEGAVKQYEKAEKWLDILVSNAGGPGPTRESRAAGG